MPSWREPRCAFLRDPCWGVGSRIWEKLLGVKLFLGVGMLTGWVSVWRVAYGFDGGFLVTSSSAMLANSHLPAVQSILVRHHRDCNHLGVRPNLRPSDVPPNEVNV